MKVQYFGGPVFNGPRNPKVYLIFWGNEWSSNKKSPTKSEIISQTNILVRSRYFEPLSQYGISKPASVIPVNNTTWPIPPANVIFKDIGAVVMDTMNHNIIPHTDINQTRDRLGNWFDREAIYMVMMPPSVQMQGYHGMHGMWGSGNSQAHDGNFAAATIPWESSQLKEPLLPHPNNHLENFMQALSHELVDTLTNPVVTGGFVQGQNGFMYMGNCSPYSNVGCELAQVCGKNVELYNGVAVEAYYSDKDDKCIIPSGKNITGVNIASNVFNFNQVYKISIR